MPGAVNSSLIPGRFLMTIGHLISLLMLFYIRELNVLNSCDGCTVTSSEFQDMDTMLVRALWGAVVCFIIEFIGFLGGFSMFMPLYNTLYILLHFIGTVATCWYMLDLWYYSEFYTILWFTNILPAAIELFAILRVLKCKVVQY